MKRTQTQTQIRKVEAPLGPPARITTLLTTDALALLKAECERQTEACGFHVSYGGVLTQIIRQQLGKKRK